METFHLLHLARSWPSHSEQLKTTNSPISSRPAALSMTGTELSSQSSSQSSPVDVAKSTTDGRVLVPHPRIRAASAQMVFAARGSRDFITPEQVIELEGWSARAVLEAATKFKIENEVLVFHDFSVTVYLCNHVCRIAENAQ